MTLELKWAWELTPKQLFAKNTFVSTSTTSELWQESKAFTTPKLALDGTELQYQLGLTTKGRNEEAQLLRSQHPDLPDSGDYRSGVLFFSSDRIVASLILSGLNTVQPFKMVVNPERRGEKLGERLLVEWWSKVRHTYRESGSQPMNVASVKVLLSAYRKVVHQVEVAERSVPSLSVIDSEAKEVLAMALAAEKS